MRICKIIRYDLKQGFLQNVWKLIFVAGMAIVFCVDFYFCRKNVENAEHIITQATYGDYLFYILGGPEVFEAGINSTVPFPARWLLVNSFILYSTLYYSIRELNNEGKIILPKTKSRWNWWLSKCIWNSSYTLSSYVIFYSIILGWCILNSEKVSLEITQPLIDKMLNIGNGQRQYDFMLSVYILIIPMCIIVAFNIVQMALSLVVHPILSFGIMEVIFILSIYYSKHIFIGNYAMPIRSEYVIYRGTKFFDGIMWSLILYIVGIILGWCWIRKYDVLQNKN